MNFPINLHVTDPLTVNDAVTMPTPLPGYLRLKQRFTDAKFIFAHLGGGISLFELKTRGRTYIKNVWYCTASSPSTYNTRGFRQIVDFVWAGIIFFGF